MGFDPKSGSFCCLKDNWTNPHMKNIIKLMLITLNDMDIKVIKTEEEYNQSLLRLEAIFDAPADTIEGDEAELLGILIEKFEDEHYPIEAPDPINAIKFRMEQMNLDNQDLAKVIGYNSRVSEIFNRKRKLTLKMIRNLHDKLKIPYESLITDYK